MTEQQLFDTIVNHLRAQGRKSLNEDGKPAYRGVNGCRCPIGAMLLDNDYSPKMENNTVIQLLGGKLLSKKLIKEWEPHQYFLQRLQYVHDHVDVDMWESNFEWIAREYGLNHSPIKKDNETLS